MPTVTLSGERRTKCKVIIAIAATHPVHAEQNVIADKKQPGKPQARLFCDRMHL